MLSSKTYDTLKWIVTIALPALQALWLGLGQVWNFPYVTEVGTTIALVTAFLGALIGISNSKYKNNFEVENVNSNYDEAEVVEEESEGV